MKMKYLIFFTCGLWLILLFVAADTDYPTYRREAKDVEGGYPGQTTEDTTGCSSKVLLLGCVVCVCAICLQFCNKSETNNPNCLTDIFRTTLANPTNNSNPNYSSVDTQIVTDQPHPTDDTEMRNRGFSKDVCRSMVAMLDADRSGKLGFEEFKSLWSDIRDWKNVFRLYDKDNSGTLDGFELRQALNSAGYHLNNHILNILMHRYGNKEGQLEFDDFIMCAVKLKTMILRSGGISEQALIEEIQREDAQYDDRYF